MSPVDRAAHLNRWRHRSLTEKAALALGMLLLAFALPPGPGAPDGRGGHDGGGSGGRARAGENLAGLCGGAAWASCWSALFRWRFRLECDGLGLAPGGLTGGGRLVERILRGFDLPAVPGADDAGHRSDRWTASPWACPLKSPNSHCSCIAFCSFWEIRRWPWIRRKPRDSAISARNGALRSLGRLIANLLPRALDRARRLEVGARGAGLERRSPRAVEAHQNYPCRLWAWYLLP